MECALCKALENNENRILYKNNNVFVMVNIEPLKDGHIMILPVRHAEQLEELTPTEAQAFLKAIDASFRAVTAAYNETPICLINGSAHRTQPHLHAHVLPSKHNLRSLFVSAEGLEERKRADDSALAAIAEKLKKHFITSD